MSTVVVSKLTEADVIAAAIKQLEKPDGYTDGYYFRHEAGGNSMRPGEHVGACCAIGSIEQAIWKLTGSVVTKERHAAAYRSRKPSDRKAVTRLYVRTMKLLNAVAKETPAAKEFDRGGCAIEQLTFYRAKRTVLKAFRTALERATS